MGIFGFSQKETGAKSVAMATTLGVQGSKWGYLVFHRKRLEPRVLPWQ